MKSLGLVALLAGCWTTHQTAPAPKGPPPDVTVSLAAVTLGDDCPDPEPDTPGRPQSISLPADCSSEGCGGSPMHCEQTTMQLSLRATGGEGMTDVRVKKVELLDGRGNFLAELASRLPSKWGGSRYVAWNQKIAGGEQLNATYALSAPDWNTLTGGRWNAQSKIFQLRVTLAIGSQDRVVAKQSIIPAILPPPVPT